MKTPTPPRQATDTHRPRPSGTPGQAPGRASESEPDSDPQMQGEGNITAARRHRKSAEDFVASGQVDKAARDAAPDSPGQARDLRDAEKAGKAPARR